MDSNKKLEFGDFQTPESLCDNIIQTIPNLHKYKTFIEPTCGNGYFLHSLKKAGISMDHLIGWEINPQYVDFANNLLNNNERYFKKVVRKQNFFHINWKNILKILQPPVFFIGNPPWATNSELGKLKSINRPIKQNVDSLHGLDAITGKSNYDISEYMIRKIIDFISGKESAIYFLLKTSVARKLFYYMHETKKKIQNVTITKIDAKKNFGVSVDACLFTAHGSQKHLDLYQCEVRESLHSKTKTTMQISNKSIISDIHKYNQLSVLDTGSEFIWRSGIKHDASKVMEFTINKNHGDKLINGFGKEIDIPFDYLYPMYKSSHISKKVLLSPSMYMLVTQKKIGESTQSIRITSPKTWNYLNVYKDILNLRGSSIYSTTLPFSIFGVGDYTFKKWKVAISGMYKNIQFSVIGLYCGKPIVLDDTCYFIGFSQREQAEFVSSILNSQVSKNFISSIVFYDNKRPITASILNRINIRRLSKILDLEYKYDSLFDKNNRELYFEYDAQLSLF